MKITLLSDDRIRVDGGAGPMSVEAESAEMTYSPYHMLASGLATCTLSVLHAWATNAKLPADGLALEVGWTFVEDPHRVGSMQVEIEWPGLPANRLAAAKRVADLCTVKATFAHPPAISTDVKAEARAA
ncbi:OsmC family protein [Longimicrobium sp.]|uniref:OsmC family protein n=1 Tax=Longimicrobium sp. TaxID=2029185 RepID=UPI002BB0BFA7|nr:OsmC family protein [Longimicrobium sp.]HSU15062.1 OsmC family protein [Longimicrobium sp.]